MTSHKKFQGGFAPLIVMGVIALGLISGFVGSKIQQDIPREDFQLGAINAVGGKNYYLYGGGISSSDSSVTLTSFKTPVSDYVFSMNDFGTIGYITIEPGSATRQEFASFSGLTQNSDGSATLTGVARGLSPITPYTASTTLQKAHPGGSVVVLSNSPQFYTQFSVRANDELISGLKTASSTNPWKFDNDFVVGSTTRVFAPVNWVVNNFLDIKNTASQTLAGAYTFSGANVFTSLPTSSATPTGNSDLTTKTYVDGVAIAGAPDANATTKGIVEQATAAEITAATATGGTSAALFISPDKLAESGAWITRTVSTTTLVSQATTTLTNIPQGKKLSIDISIASTTIANDGVRIWFNDATGGFGTTTAQKYLTSTNYDGANAAGNGAANSIVLPTNAAAQNHSQFIHIDMQNGTTTLKYGMGTSFFASSTQASAGNLMNFGFAWSTSTTAITSVSVAPVKPGPFVDYSFGAGTTITAYTNNP